jgi:histidinol-phosphate aminotransferase
MPVSRRRLLQSLGATIVAGGAAQSLSGLSFAELPRFLPNANSLPRPIFLDQNENGYGPSEKVLTAIRDAAFVSNRYARTEYDSLINKIAALHSVKPEQIALTCGSSEILRLAAAEFLSPGKKLVQAAPTFPLLGQAARSAGVEVVDVPLAKTWQHDLNAMLAQAGNSAGLVYICNPNNPTGTLTPRKNIEDFVHNLPAKTMVLIDEAYHHFVQPSGSYTSFLDQPLDDPRVMVVRTFSHVYGLAGMRVGYVVAMPDIARRFSAHQLHFGISTFAVRAAAAALDDTEYVRLCVKRNADDRQEFINQAGVRMIHALDSQTNFLAVNPLRSEDQVVEHLKSNNIHVGPLDPAMPKYIRVSLGIPADMLEFWRVLDQLPVTEKMHM